MLLGRLHQRPRPRRIDLHRLFAERGLAVLQRQQRVLTVVGVRRGDVDRVDLWIRDQLFVRAIGTDAALLRDKSAGPLQRTRTRREQPCIRQPL